ncbi:hypothetical protein SanaruYs_23230 [Chryseotalea sanaruensis]|uniref:HTTM-like domain-containing protein n=1 Tax=Chryseotalea sanaruensis TaxID=2482724 RepID=A0A401UB35_9BACT|nr:sporulation-delaying protein SdpB family protein [Chryseotalea sanaruensis]GCC52091.1 hypothetical protein SanaruYs_23230 [Chryseotalea sanaruensis]
MIKSKLDNFESFIRRLSKKYDPHTNVIGLGRSILAIGTLLTLLTNPTHYLFNKSTEGVYFNPLLNTDQFTLNKLNFFLLLGADHAYLMQIAAIVILIVVVSGYFIKVTSVLHWWIAVSFMLSSSLLDGGDQIAAIMSLLLIPICITDTRKNHWEVSTKRESASNVLAIMAVWLIRIQVAIIYLDAATGKFPVTEWANGTALYYWLNHSVFGIQSGLTPLLNPVLSNKFLEPILTYSVLILELLLFTSIFASVRFRKRILPIAISFHLFIIIFHGIFSFFFSIVCGLVLYLYPTYHDLKFKALTLKIKKAS